MKRLVPFLLLCAGCGSTTTDTAFSPAQATAVVQPQTIQARQLVATLDNGGQVGLVLTPTAGSLVTGRAVLTRGTEKLPMHASGSLEGAQASLRLTPDSRSTATRAFVITGPLGGAGKWADRAARTTGNLTLTEAEHTGLVLGKPLSIAVPALRLTVTCTPGSFNPDTGGYTGRWLSNQPLGASPFQLSEGLFTASVDPTGEATVQLDFGAGLFQFPVPAPGSPTPLNGESDVVVDSLNVAPLVGNVTVAQ